MQLIIAKVKNLAFGNIVKDVRKNILVQRNTPQIAQNDITDAILENPKPTTQKRDISYKDSQITGYIPQTRNYFSNQSTDPRHGSIIRNIASASNSNLQSGSNTSWENCKYRKNSSGMDFCSEYHSLCAKEKCRRAKN